MGMMGVSLGMQRHRVATVGAPKASITLSSLASPRVLVPPSIINRNVAEDERLSIVFIATLNVRQWLRNLQAVHG